MRFAPLRSNAPLWIASCLSFAGLAAIASRVPISEGDDAFYASVAHALPSHGSFDYLRFYGPVFFHTVALSFACFGFSVASLRLVSLLGAILVAVAGVALARALGADSRHQAWACALLLLTPELGWAATAGRMDSLAVGLELLGLAALVHGLAKQRDPWTHGVVGGMLVAAAALTTPRTFPFVLALLVAAAAVLPSAEASLRRQAIHMLTAAAATALVLFGLWIAFGAGGFSSWLHMMWAIATQQRDDVALLPNLRPLGFGWSRIVTPVAAIAGGLLVAPRRSEDGPEALAARFALVAVWTAFIAAAVLFAMPFFFATYFVLPLFAVVVARAHRLRLPARGAAAIAVSLLLCFGAMRVAKHVIAAVTWSARDPAVMDAFITAHVPPGSTVVGPHFLYYFPVTRAGSRYRTGNQVNWADWTQWIPASARSQRDRATARQAEAPSSGIFLLWPTDEDLVYGPLPRGACPPGPPVATYDPPPDDLPSLSQWATNDLRGFPRATLYRLTGLCGVEP